MEFALRNPLILSNIFSRLDFASLKTTRSVCSLWADEAAHPLGLKSVLKVHKVFPHCCTATGLPSHFDPKLAVHVDINLNCGGVVTGNYSHSAKRESRAAAVNISTFLSASHQNIETIKVTNNFAFPVFRSLTKLGFPKLKCFQIIGSDFCEENYTPKIDAELLYCVTKSLKRVEFTLPKEFGNAMSDLYDIFQDLIDCAENLEVLKIQEFYVPNLDNCKKLKVLEYTGFPKGALLYRGPCVQNGGFDVEPLHDMLEGVKDSLEVLTIACRHDLLCRHVQVELEDFQTPVMTKLEKLCINGFAMYGFATSITKNQFPKLKMLAVSGEYIEAKDMFEAPFPCEVSKDGVKIFDYDMHLS